MTRFLSLHLLMMLILVGLAGVILLDIKPSGAQTASLSSWLKTEPPIFTNFKSDVPSDQLPAYNSKDCLPNTKFITIPKDILKLRAESSYQTCAIQTSFGQQSASTGQIKLNDTSVAGIVRSSSGINLIPLAIPNSNHIIYPSGGLDGSYLFTVKDFAKNSSVVAQPDGSIIHQLNPGVFGSIVKDAAGNSLVFADTRFSDNGKWMIGDVPGRGMTRLNVETGETLTFGPPYNYSIGLKPKFVSAISGDGRYVLAAEFSYEVLKLYDLSTCKPAADPTKQASCQSKDLLPAARSQIAGYKNVYFAGFSTDYTIRMYIQHNGADKKDHYGFYAVTAAGEKESLLDYLALGDSFASGEGAFNYRSGTDVQKPFNKCHLSLLSYPYLLAAKTSLNAVQSVACSGAKMKDVYSGDETSYNANQKQSEGKELPGFDDEIYHSFLVGYRPQLNFAERNKPGAITISIGGNDIGFGQILLACLKSGTCYSDPQERLNLVYTINTKFDEFVSAYRQAKNSAASDAGIYVVGYPVLADPKGNCALNVHLDSQEILFANQIVGYLNSVISRAAQKAGVKYIDVEQAFAGHKLCEAVSSDVAVNGLTAGDEKTFTIPLRRVDRSLDIFITGHESYHPNQLGHRLLADAVATATHNLASKTPDPVINMSNPLESDAAGLVSGSSLNVAPRRIISEEAIVNNLLVAGQTSEFKADNLKPSSDASIWLTSEQNKIGSFKAADTGQLMSMQ
jgi:lysophospholipase L1-like esterase